MAQQQAKITALLRELGQASANAIRAAWPRDHVESEPALALDVVAQFRMRARVRPQYAPVVGRRRSESMHRSVFPRQGRMTGPRPSLGMQAP